jgi:hypothetical protein
MKVPGRVQPALTPGVAIVRLLEAEQDPKTQGQLMQIWSVNAQHQQQIAYRLLHGERLPGIYSYSTNRRPFG